MKQKIGLTVAGLMLSTSAFALEGAYGQLEGTLGAYGLITKPKDKDTDDLGYENAHLRLAYTTPSFAGFSAKVEGKWNAKLFEEKDEDYKEGAPFENKALLTQGYLQFAIEDAISIKAGRYEGELEWFTDYQQGAIAEISLPDTLVSIGYSHKTAESGVDLSKDFKKPSEKGVYLMDIQNESLSTVKFNPYYYQMPDYGRFFGLKIDFDERYFDLALQYATSKEDDIPDGTGNIATIEAALKITEDKGRLFAGYIKTDKENGADLIASFGDNSSPFEDGVYVYNPNAKTWYVGANVTDNRSIVTYKALYGVTQYEALGLKNKELNVGIDFNIAKALDIDFMFVLSNNDNDTLDYKKYILGIEYNF